MVEKQYCFEMKEVGANLNDDHEVFNLMHLIDIFKEFYPREFLKKSKSKRHAKYHPKELLTFVLWGKNNNKESCRELSKWCENNDETCQLVLKCTKPGKDTINRFKNENTELVELFDQFLIDFGMAIGLIGGKILYGDGTVLKAWCNTFKKMYPYEIDYLKTFLKSNGKNKKLWTKLQKYYKNEEKDTELKKELQETLDEFEYNLNANGIHLLKTSLTSKDNYNKVLEKLEHMEENRNGEKSISIIDPESRHILGKKGNMGLNYNYQTVTDNKYGFRITHYLTNRPNDQKELKTLVELTTQRIHTENFTLCVDNGYWNPEQLKEISKTNTQIVIPDDTAASRKKKKIQKQNRSGKRQEIINNKNKKNNTKNKPKRIKKHQFKYLGEIDAFECPKTKKLLKFVDIVTITGVEKKKYTTDHCLHCEFKNECTSQHRRIFYQLYDEDIEKIRKYYYSKEGQEIYCKRGHFAETSFAVLESRNFRGIKTKGLEKANNELTLSEIHHNIKKFEKHTTNEFLKEILKIIKEYKKNYRKIDFSLLEKLREKYIMEKDVIIRIEDIKTLLNNLNNYNT